MSKNNFEVYEKINYYNYTICIIRILSCFLIVWNHTSGAMLNHWGNPLYWANIGVQVFFFMSGYLYGGKKIAERTQWLKKNIFKICKPYWIYLSLILPIISVLTVDNVTVVKSVAAYLCLQGFGENINGIGQHWFISYILICYLLTAFILDKYFIGMSSEKKGGIVGYGLELDVS